MNEEKPFEEKVKRVQELLGELENELRNMSFGMCSHEDIQSTHILGEIRTCEIRLFVASQQLKTFQKAVDMLYAAP